MEEYRIERDSMGEMRIASHASWGAQTQRSVENFRIGWERMPLEAIYAIAQVKKACALANAQCGKMPQTLADTIATVCDRILRGELDAQFPLKVWQTGSGTQTNMNLNEVIAHEAGKLLGQRVHPNDAVNLSQSSNDVFPTAMHLAVLQGIERELLPALAGLEACLDELAAQYPALVKIGRTHLQDAVPLRFAQEVGAWRDMMVQNQQMLRIACVPLQSLAIGGTAVGTGLNAPADFDARVCALLRAQTGLAVQPAADKFQALSSKSALVFAHGALKALAADLMKIANDVRLLSSGPRCGIGEITIPENEPGSSIMPGKVNPTQCEMLTMIACQVMGNDACVGMAASQGNFQLNVFMPVLLYNVLQSIRLLSDGVKSFTENCARGIRPQAEKMASNLHHSLMLVTALSPHIGYDQAAKVAHYAHVHNLTLQQAAKECCQMSEEEFARLVRPETMV